MASVAADLVNPSLPQASVGRYRWLICLLLFLSTTVNYIDRQILALLKPILDDELDWTNEQYGNVNAAFAGAYAVGLLLFRFQASGNSTAGYAVLFVLCGSAYLLAYGVGHVLAPRLEQVKVRDG